MPSVEGKKIGTLLSQTEANASHYATTVYHPLS